MKISALKAELDALVNPLKVVNDAGGVTGTLTAVADVTQAQKNNATTDLANKKLYEDKLVEMKAYNEKIILRKLRNDILVGQNKAVNNQPVLNQLA